MNLYEAVDKLKSLIKKNGRNIIGEQHTKQVEHFDKQNGKGRKKNGRRPRFLV